MRWGTVDNERWANDRGGKGDYGMNTSHHELRDEHGMSAADGHSSMQQHSSRASVSRLSWTICSIITWRHTHVRARAVGDVPHAQPMWDPSIGLAVSRSSHSTALIYGIA